MPIHEIKHNFLSNRKLRFLMSSSIVFQWFENIAKQSWMLWPIPCWIARISSYSQSVLRISSKPQQKLMNSNTFSSFFCGVFGRPERQEVSNTSRFGRVSPHLLQELRSSTIHGSSWISCYWTQVSIQTCTWHLFHPARAIGNVCYASTLKDVCRGGVAWTRHKSIKKIKQW